MKNYWRASTLLALYLVSVALAAQDLVNPTGWWRAKTQTPDGEISTDLRLDYVAGEVSGTFGNSFISARLSIYDSGLDGNEVYFKLELMTRVLQYNGEINGDEMLLSSRVIEGEPFPGLPEVSTVTLTRDD